MTKEIKFPNQFNYFLCLQKEKILDFQKNSLYSFKLKLKELSNMLYLVCVQLEAFKLVQNYYNAKCEMKQLN